MHKTIGEHQTCTSEDMITDRQAHTRRQTRSSQYSAPLSGRGNQVTADLFPASREPATQWLRGMCACVQDWCYGAVLRWWRPWWTRLISVSPTTTATTQEVGRWSGAEDAEVGHVSDCTTAASSDSACVDRDIRPRSTATDDASTVRPSLVVVGL